VNKHNNNTANNNSEQTQIDNVKRSNDNSNKIEKDNNHRPQMLTYSTENQEQSMDDSITHIKTVHSRQTLKGDTTSQPHQSYVENKESDQTCTCSVCDKNVGIDDLAVEYSKCSNWYHYNCEHLNSREIQKLEEDPSIKYTCSVCNSEDESQRKQL
jgi:hypothetical protein